MKPCNNCGTVKADEDFAKDVSRDDGLALICRACNSEKCKRWYRANQERARRRAIEYKATHAGATGASRPSIRKTAKPPEEPDDYQLIRFTESEWLFCLQEAQSVGIQAQEYVRNLVRDARHTSRRSGIETDTEGDAHAQV